MRREATGRRESLDKGLNTVRGHGVLGVELGDSTFHEQRGEERRGSVTGLELVSTLEVQLM